MDRLTSASVFLIELLIILLIAAIMLSIQGNILISSIIAGVTCILAVICAVVSLYALEKNKSNDTNQADDGISPNLDK